MEENETLTILKNICKDLRKSKTDGICEYAERKRTNANSEAFNGAITLLAMDIGKLDHCLDYLNKRLIDTSVEIINASNEDKLI